MAPTPTRAPSSTMAPIHVAEREDGGIEGDQSGFTARVHGRSLFGQIKSARGFRQFLLRGVAKVRREWDLVCTAHNFLKWAAVQG